MKKTFRLSLVDDGGILGVQWFAIDNETGEIIYRSFGKWIAQKEAEQRGYTLIESAGKATYAISGYYSWPDGVMPNTK